MRFMTQFFIAAFLVVATSGTAMAVSDKRLILSEEIERAVADAMGIDDDGDGMMVRLTDGGLVWQAMSNRPIAVRDIKMAPDRKRFTATLVLPAAKGAVEEHALSGRVYRSTRIPVLARSFEAGEVVGKDDIQWIEVAQRKVRGNTLTNASAMIGKAPRRNIRAGRPLRRADFREPLLVTKGSLVTLVLRTPQLVVTVKGKALENGARGDTIRVLNTSSNRTIEGTVLRSGAVGISYPSVSPR